MSSIVDERGFNQAYQLNIAQRARLQRRARAIVSKIRLSAEHGRNLDVHIPKLRDTSTSSKRADERGGIIATAVIDEHGAPGAVALRIEQRGEPREQFGQHRVLVEHRDDNGDDGGGHS
jgi:hypothetical protein